MLFPILRLPHDTLGDIYVSEPPAPWKRTYDLRLTVGHPTATDVYMGVALVEVGELPAEAPAGDVIVSAGVANATASAVDPSVLFSSLSFTPDPAIALASAVDPTFIAGSLAIAPGAAAALASAVDPTVTLGSVVVASAISAAIASAVDPTVISGSVIVSGGTAAALASAVDPTVILGSLIVSAGVANATASGVDPSVTTGGGQTVAVRFALQLQFVVQVTIFPPGAEIEAVYAPLLGIEAAAPPLNNEANAAAKALGVETAAPPLYNETHAPPLGLEEIR